MNKAIRFKLILMMVLEFFIWGAWFPLIFGYLPSLGFSPSEHAADYSLLKLTISQIAPILPYLFLVLILIFRPKGLLGTREG